MSTPHDIAVIIVSWNVREQLLACLASLHALPEAEQPNTIWVVDNASTDGSAVAVRAQFPEVRLLAQATNVGFATANNLVLQQIAEPFALLLNPDTLVPAGCFPALLAAAERNPRAGIVGPKLLNLDGSWQPSVRRLPHVWTLVGIALKVTHWWPSLLRKYLAKDLDPSKEQKVEQLMGAALLIRKDVWKHIGLLDTHFHVWFEEVDYCARTKQAGWDIWYVPDAVLTHLGGQSFRQVPSVRRQRQWMQSVNVYARKYFTLPSHVLIWCAGWIGLFLVWLASLVTPEKKAT
ncbi:MAG: glycosyltransferase family 2 protein [Patescibacteria group bacterium]|jgi:hypothetical protein